MKELNYNTVNQEVLQAMSPPGKLYPAVVAFWFMGILTGLCCWAYQILMGLGVEGVNHPIAWGTYLVNFVFFVGLAHSGTLISAILFLFRARWRTAISRSAEAMTVFAVMVAGLFPFIHLGRVWVVYWILPYPNQRNLWPDFQSPLVFDVIAISTYLLVSILFWYTGLQDYEKGHKPDKPIHRGHNRSVGRAWVATGLPPYSGQSTFGSGSRTFPGL